MGFSKLPSGTWLLIVALAAAGLVSTGCQDSPLRDGPVVDVDGPDDEDPVAACAAPDSVGYPILITEVMYSNTMTIADEDGEFEPWIEIHNPTGAEVSLQGAGLTDDSGIPRKWFFPCIPEAVIGPGEFLIIFCDGETDDETGGFATIADPAGPDTFNVFHASFVLTPGMDPQSLAVNGVFPFTDVDASIDIPDDITFGRFPETSDDFVELSMPTPGRQNAISTNPPEIEFIRGDVNQDGLVDDTDLTLLLDFVFDDTTPPECQDPLDVNDDGEVNLTDANFLSLALEDGGPTIPAPFPDPGFDPTVDELTSCLFMGVTSSVKKGGRP